MSLLDSSGSGRTHRRFPRRPVFRGLAAGLLVLGLAGCSEDTEWGRLGLPAPATEEAPRVLDLWQGVWIAAILVGLVVWGLIIYSWMFHRKRSDELPPQVRYNLPIEVLYTTLPFVIILGLFYFTVRDQNELLSLEAEPDHTINVVGKRWSWDFNYIDEDENVYVTGTPGVPPTLVLPINETIRFELTSPDVIHSFWVPAFLFKLDVIPGQVNVFQATPSREGRFVGKCAELCGVDHARMLFNVEVVSSDEYDDFIESLRDAGQTGSTNTGVTRSGIRVGGAEADTVIGDEPQ